MPNFTEERLGTPVLGDIFISLCIPTYRRAPKVARLMRQLTRVIAASSYRTKIEVVISNNASPDATADAIRAESAGLATHCRVRVYTQHENIGGEANFRFLYEHAEGRYVWIFPDDDILYEDQFDRLIADLERVAPEICLSSFCQPPWDGDRRMFDCGGAETALVEDLRQAIPHLVRFPKLTAYVYRRRVLAPREQASSIQAAETTSFWFVTLCLLLLNNHENRLLLRSPNVAHADEDFLDLNFSPRVYLTMAEAVRLGLTGHEAPEPLIAEVTILDIPMAVVGLVFRHTVGLSTLAASVAESDYRYIRENLRAMVTHGWRNALKVPVILVLYPLVGRARGRPTGP